MRLVIKCISCLIGVLFVCSAITEIFLYVNFRYFLKEFTPAGLVGLFFLWLAFSRSSLDRIADTKSVMKSVLKYISCLIGVLFVYFAIKNLFYIRYLLRELTFEGLVGLFFLWLAFRKSRLGSFRESYIAKAVSKIAAPISERLKSRYNLNRYNFRTGVLLLVFGVLLIALSQVTGNGFLISNWLENGGVILIIFGVIAIVIEYVWPSGIKMPPPASKSAEERLNQLNELRVKQLISDAEYEQRRKDILASL